MGAVWGPDRAKPGFFMRTPWRTAANRFTRLTTPTGMSYHCSRDILRASMIWEEKPMAKKKRSKAQTPKMTAREFVAKTLDDKEFRREVLIYSYGQEFKSGDPDALPKWLNAGARLMGHRFFDKDVIDEFNSQISALGFFKRTKIMGTLMGNASAARKGQS